MKSSREAELTRLQILLFASHNVVIWSTNTEWRQLLRMIRCFVVFSMYLSFSVHTEETIANGRKAEESFGKALVVGLQL